jgi:hypothetical protein
VVPWQIKAAAYDRTLDRIVFVSATPDQLHIYDGAGKIETGTVDLGASPSTLALSPDGNYAAVGTDGRILRIDLSKLAVTGTYRVPFLPSALALSASHLYSVGPTVFEPSIRLWYTNLTSGQTARTDYGAVNTGRLLLPDDGAALFALGSAGAQRWALSSGVPSSSAPAVLAGNVSSSCDDGWLFQGSTHLVTGCGEVFQTPTTAPSRVGQFPIESVSSLTMLPSRGQVLLIPGRYVNSVDSNELQTYLWPGLTFVSKSVFPELPGATTAPRTRGAWLFSGVDENTLHAILTLPQLNPSTDPPVFGIYSVGIGVQNACRFSVSPQSLTLDQAGHSRVVQVTTQQSCSWAPRKTAEWLQTAGTGVGSGSFSIYANPNTDSARRTGIVRMPDGTSISVTQASLLECGFSVPPAAAWITGAQWLSVAVEATAGCAWNVESASPSVWFPVRDTETGYFVVAEPAGAVPGTVYPATAAGRSLGLAVLPAGGCKTNLSKVIFDSAGHTGAAILSFSGSCPDRWSLIWSNSWAQMYPTSGPTATPQTVQFTVFPNFSRRVRNGMLSFGLSVASVPFAQGAERSSSDDARFVGRTYFAALGRAASQAEIDFQVRAALNKGVSRADLMMNFLNSAEFHAGGRFIAGLYVGLLARDGEYGGWAFQRNAFLSGEVSQESLVTNFLNSAEWKLRFGNPSDAEFVRLLYRHVLLREATQAEVDFQAGAVISQGRTAIARNFLNSQEFRIGVGSRLTGFLLYAALLGRDPRSDELAAAIARLASGTALNVLVGEVVDSAEFNGQVN